MVEVSRCSAVGFSWGDAERRDGIPSGRRHRLLGKIGGSDRCLGTPASSKLSPCGAREVVAQKSHETPRILRVRTHEGRGSKMQDRPLVGIPDPPSDYATQDSQDLDCAQLVHRYNNSIEGPGVGLQASVDQEDSQLVGACNVEGTHKESEVAQQLAAQEVIVLHTSSAWSDLGPDATVGLEICGRGKDAADRLYASELLGNGSAENFSGKKYTEEATSTLAVHSVAPVTLEYLSAEVCGGDSSQRAPGVHDLQRVSLLAQDLSEGM